LRKIILFLYISIALQLFAEENPEYKKLITSGEKLAYNFEFDSCQSIVQTAIELVPESPEAFQLLSKIHLWYYLGSKDQSDFKLFFDYSDSALIRTNNLLEENEEDKFLLYILGNIYKYKAMAYGTKGNTLDAFWSTKKAVSYYEDVIELDTNFYSAYGGIGVFEYALSYVPALFNWALSLSGLSADQNNGFNFIKIASTNGVFDKTEYKFHLAKLYDEHLADYDQSLILIKELLKEYPNNTLFHYQAAIEYIKSRNLDKAIEELEIVMEFNHPKFIQTNSFSNFLMGDVYFRKNNFEKALEYYLKFLTTTQTIDYTGIASLRTAYCYYFLDNDMEFKRYAFLAANGNHDLEDDKFAFEMSLLVLEKGFSKDSNILFEIENSYLSGDDIKTLEIIEDSLDSLQNEDTKAQVLIYKSTILINMNKVEESRVILEEIDSLDIDASKWVEPMNLLNLAEISFRKNNFDLAYEYLDSAEDRNDYQKKNLIQSYINGLKSKLDKIN